jgi:SAM-dependent methyltransferase
LRPAVSISRPHYDGTATNWRDVYQSADPFGRRMQRRRDAVVDAVRERLGDRQPLILDAGCGTGEVARPLAAMGCRVVGLDRSSEMVGEARLSSMRVEEPPVFLRGDVESLPFRSDSFAAVLCVGVLDYLLPRRHGCPEDAALPAITELVRVLKPGGFLVITAPNLIRLHWILDPLQLWRALKHQWRLRTLLDDGAGKGAAAPADAAVEPWRTWRWTPRQFRRLLARRRVRIVKWSGIGFGPFSILGRSVFSPTRSVTISGWLERLARRNGLRFLSQLAATWLITLAP